jgi:superfamily II DNA or RNA helicase
MISLSYYEAIHKSSLPGVWSKGVALSRANAIVLHQHTPEEISLRVRSQERPVSHKITLWPGDEDWYCDCDSRNEVCAHVAAAVIFLKSQQQEQKHSTPLSSSEPRSTDKPQYTEIHYEFHDIQDSLELKRWVVYGKDRKELLLESLTSIVGGISSGRIQAPPISVTQEEYRVDAFMNPLKRAILDSEVIPPLFKIISECSHLFFDGNKVSISPQPYSYTYVLISEKGGFRLKLKEDGTDPRIFANGVILFRGTLRPLDKHSRLLQSKPFHSREGVWYGPKDTLLLMKDILPELTKIASVDIQAQNLPELVKVSPEVTFITHKPKNSDELFITPQIKNRMETLASNQDRILIHYSDPFEEKALGRKLQNELQLAIGQTTCFTGESAVEFCLRLKNWCKEREGKLEGQGYRDFELNPALEWMIDFQGGEPEFIFKTTSGDHSADPQSVLRAWRENSRYIKLMDGGWAQLPQNLLSRFSERIEALLTMKSTHGKIPSHFLPELIQICDETHQTYPDAIQKLKTALYNRGSIEQFPLPSDLQAQLRHYQQEGVNWLCFLRNAQMGAMLADDMGLGKTLQTLCAIQGKTLIIAPTSVLPSWQTQIQTFRPQLKVCTYYGPQRRMDPTAQVILTSYALVRLDAAEFTHTTWDTIVLDEAQTIKNPESQISRVIHQLNGNFKLALSGTPIENQLEDLWSQFQFLNPGLLGSRELFQDTYASPILRGDRRASEQLQQRIKPFILRRLKKDVLPELPAKTEIVLYSELNDEEFEVYGALFHSTRKEVLAQLEQGGGVFGALELLLRLRQACCATALVPGQHPVKSSKIELLMQTLEKSIAFGHRALIFSQWTSYLDLIEEEMRERKITFSRLDGSTRNRKEIVDEFQSSSGASALLISLKAGGTGLTLTAADHIFIMDPWWNPAIEDQAADRAHRIGQKNPVWVHRLITSNTIEEKILSLQKAKAQLSQHILEDTGVAASLTREDILALLQG